MKKVLLAVVGILLLLLLAAILAPFVLDLNKHKDTILAQVKDYVPRDVDFEHVELTILTGLGVEVQGLRISDNPDFSQLPFLTLERLRVRVQILPLFRKEIRVGKIILRKPVIHVLRNDEGEFNFADLLSSKGDKTEKGDSPSEAMPEQGEDKVAGLGILAGLLVKELEIGEGRVMYQDGVLFSGEPPLVVDALDLKLTDLSLTRPVSIKMGANMMEALEQNFSLEGKIGPVGEAFLMDKMPVDLRVSLEALPTNSLPKPLLDKLPVEVLVGDITLALAAKGVLADEILSETEINLKGLVLNIPKETGAGEKTGDLDCSLTLKLKADYVGEAIGLESGSLSVNGNRLLLKGALKNILSEPEWDLKVWAEEFRPDSLLALFAGWSEEMFNELKMEGPLKLEIESSGNANDFKVQSQMDLKAMNIRYADSFRKPGEVPLSVSLKAGKKDDRVAVKQLKLILHHLVMNGSGEMVISDKTRFGFLVQTPPVSLQGWASLVPSLSPYDLEGSFYMRSSLRGNTENASVNLQLSSDQLRFSLPPAEDEKREARDRPGIVKALEVELQVKKRGEELLSAGKVEARQGHVESVSFNDFLSRFRYDPDGLTISGLELKVFQGDIQGSGSYDLTSGKWEFLPVIRGVAAGDALAALTEFKNIFSGTFTGNFKAQGSVKEGQEDALNANGKFRVSQGALKNFDLGGKVFEMLFGIPGVAEVMGSMDGEVQHHDATRFDWLDGQFSMAGQTLLLERVHLRNVRTSKATDSDVLLKGKIIPAADVLRLEGRLILSQRHSRELVREAEVFNALCNEEERIVLPITLKGSIKKPIVSLDNKFVLGAISRYYARKGVEEGVKKLGEELGLPPGGEGSGKEGENPVDKLLKDLFRQR